MEKYVKNTCVSPYPKLGGEFGKSETEELPKGRKWREDPEHSPAAEGRLL